MQVKTPERYEISQCTDAASSNPETLQRLKAALWFSIGKIVDDESLRRNRTATPQFIGALTEMAWAQIGRSSQVSDFKFVV